MKPAWNYLYESKVNCETIAHPVYWVVGYMTKHSHLVFVHTRVMH